ncbi:1,4-dihydroxy-2-naphthoate octaprenyltransferase [Caloramator mitchellensis]|uniref:1,4-dihydroxy-2-naphthoate octaprenyltransferase n=1 Tax=Caloramator mitchellensis TaxID=908809 RepID=A0A0R3JSS8_CALMK|nr:prenyltransferase [Caloramator mitchellensis]KRQ86520.1 1,4-dihydroxy-2-naphthoate octaprenyltransferase [Caloramator mitchellensis]
MTKQRIWKGFWQLADPKIWIASTIPMLVGGLFAYTQEGKFNLFWFLVSLIGVYLIEISKNATNEVIDYLSGADRFVEGDKRTPFSGGKKTIVDGILTVSEAKWIAGLTLLAACIIGLIIVFFWEFNVLYVGLFGVLIATFYTLPPLKLAYRGLGELAVGFTFGTLITSGIYIAMAHNFDYKVILLSLPIGFLITNVLWINEFPDYEADLKAGKKNWVVRLGKKKAATIYAILFALSYLSFIAISIVLKNPFYLLAFLTLPISITAVKIAKRYYDDIPNLIAANAKTVQLYMLTGVIMIIANILKR